MVRIKNRDTAVRRLSKRASEFFGMTLDDYLKQFVYIRDGTYRFNESGAQQECWFRLGCPANADEVAFALPRLDNPYRYRTVAQEE